ncbi:hypothetical protein BaRGS_00015414 [Batillaria attramentaria]|uniref:Uncharacterized protein n=1 Tax=Batillaria attramentaria TaxID=370345 RepID=A0ABD0L1U4_9CAEN
MGLCRSRIRIVDTSDAKSRLSIGLGVIETSVTKTRNSTTRGSIPASAATDAVQLSSDLEAENTTENPNDSTADESGHMVQSTTMSESFQSDSYTSGSSTQSRRAFKRQAAHLRRSTPAIFVVSPENSEPSESIDSLPGFEQSPNYLMVPVRRLPTQRRAHRRRHSTSNVQDIHELQLYQATSNKQRRSTLDKISDTERRLPNSYVSSDHRRISISRKRSEPGPSTSKQVKNRPSLTKAGTRRFVATSSEFISAVYAPEKRRIRIERRESVTSTSRSPQTCSSTSRPAQEVPPTAESSQPGPGVRVPRPTSATGSRTRRQSELVFVQPKVLVRDGTHERRRSQ